MMSKYVCPVRMDAASVSMPPTAHNVTAGTRLTPLTCVVRVYSLIV